LLEDQFEEIFSQTGFSRRTGYTITTVEEMRKELAKIREQGFSVDDEEFHAGVRCLAAPIFDASHQVVAALGNTASTTRFTKAKIGKIAGIVGGIAADISRDLGNHRMRG
jgi:IclR family acetate operon transcriptional repressor